MLFLTGDKIKLVKFTDRYVTPKYMDWLNDQDVNKFLHTGRIPISRKEITNRNDFYNIMFAMMCSLYYDKDSDQYVEEEDETYSQFIGTISLNSIDWISRKAEVSYIVGEKTHWGFGIASEAVKLVSGYAFNRLNLNKVEAGVVDGNSGSIKVLEKNGFKKYCEIPEDYFVWGKYYSTHRFYKLQGW